MNCRGVSRRLSAYIDGQLSPAIRRSVEDHLKGCLLCRRKLAEFEAIVRVTHQFPSLRVSDGFADRVIAAAKIESVKKEALAKISYRFGLASVAFMAAAAIIFFVFGQSTDVENVIRINAEVESALEVPAGPEITDFVNNPNMIVYTVPVPEDILEREKMLDDSMLLADTSSKIDQLVLPEVEKSLKVNKEF